MDHRALLQFLFQTAVGSVHPERAILSQLSDVLPFAEKGRCIVLGAGKASTQMAGALERHWPPSRPLEGFVVTRYGHADRCENIEVLEAGHPLPDSNSVLAARRMLESVRGLEPSDVVICLLSGGGSSLLCAPPPGVSLEEKRALNDQLLHCGASIYEVNCVRRHVSLIKGGRLAAAAGPARVFTLAISDVPGDDPAVIASGITTPDPSTRADALEVCSRYAIRLAPSIEAWLAKSTSESPKPGELEPGNKLEVIASSQIALSAAARAAEQAGIRAEICAPLEGDAEVAARRISMDVRKAFASQGSQPLVILYGGETTVKVIGKGVGGRCVQLLAALALELEGIEGFCALAADTDGVDGAAEIAGAFLDPTTTARARDMGLSLEETLANNDAHSFFQTLGDSLVTGPTGTNVNGFYAVYLEPHKGI